MKESTLKFCTPIERYSLPKLASYVFMYSLVMNWETRAVFPTPESPRSTTRYLDTSSISSLSVLSAPTPCPLQQEPSNGDLSPETLLFLEKQERSVFGNSNTSAGFNSRYVSRRRETRGESTKRQSNFNRVDNSD